MKTDMKKFLDEQHRQEGRHYPVIPHKVSNIETQQVRKPEQTEIRRTEDRMKEHIERVLESLRQKSDLLSFSESAPKERPYVVVHAKKGTHETHATSSYEAAKKAAAHWKLKSTAGIDSHPADVKHIATEEVELDEQSPNKEEAKAPKKYKFVWNKVGTKKIKVPVKEDVEQIDEADLPIYHGSRVAKKGLLGTKYGTATPTGRREHSVVSWDNGKHSIEHHSKLKSLKSNEKGYWDDKGGPPKHVKIKEEVELDEKVLATHKDVTVHRGGEEGSIITVKKGGKEIAKGDYDHDGGGFWLSHHSHKGQKSFDTPDEIAKHYHAVHKEEVEQIDELSKATLGSYIKKASDKATQHANVKAQSVAAIHYDSKGNPVAKFHGDMKNKRLQGIAKATDKLTKEEVEQIDESNEENARAKVRETHSQILKKGYKYIGSEQRSVGKDDSLVTHNYLSKDGSHIHHMQYSPYTMTGKGGPHIFHKKTKFNAKLHDHLTEQCFNYFDEARNTYKLYDDHKDFAKAHADIDAAVKNAHNDPTAVKKAMRKHAKVGAEDSESRDTIRASIKRRHGAEVARKTKIGLWEDAEQVDEVIGSAIVGGLVGTALGAKGAYHAAKHTSLHSKKPLRDYAKNFAKGVLDPRTYVPKKKTNEDVEQVDEGTKADIKAAAQVGRFEKHNAIQAAKSAGAPFKGPYKDAKGDVQDKSGAKHTAMSRAKHLAKMAAKKNAKLKEAVSDATTPTQAQATVAGKMSSLAQSIKSKKKTGKDEFDANPEFVSQVQPNASNY